MPWLPGEAGFEARRAKHLFWKTKLPLSHLHMDVLPFPLLLQAHFFHAFPARIPRRLRSCVPSSPVPPPQGTAVTVTCWQEGSWQRAVRLEAGFLYQLIAVLPCWEALALAVSHTSTRLFLPCVSAVFCEKPKHLLSEHRCLRKVGRDDPPGLIFLFFLIAGKHDPFFPKAPDVMPYLLSFLPPLATASLPVLHFNC